MNDELLTVAEVAARLKINQQTVRNWIERGELTSTRVGSRRVRVKVSDLEACLGTSIALPTPPSGTDKAGGGDGIPETGELSASRGTRAAPPAPASPPARAGSLTEVPKLKRAQERKLAGAVEALLDISAVLAPGSFLQRELAECAGRVQAAVRAQAPSD